MGSIWRYAVDGNTRSPRLVLDFSMVSYDLVNNTSVQRWTFYIERPYEVRSTYNKNWAVRVGNDVIGYGTTTVGGTGTKVIATGTKQFQHDSNGNLTIYAAFAIALDITWAGVETGTVTQGGNIALEQIPHYATAAQTLVAKTETTIQVQYSSDSVIDYIWYSVNNGTSWTGIDVADAASGTYMISGLSENTTYQVKTRVRRKAGQLTTDTDPMEATTYSFPYASSMPDFSIGESLTVGLYNPLGRAVIVSMGLDDGTYYGSVAANGDEVSGFNDSNWIAALYTSIPNAGRGDYAIRVAFGANVHENLGGQYIANAETGAPTIATASYADINAASIALTGNDQDIVRNQSITRFSAGGFDALYGASIVSASVRVNTDTYPLTLSGDSASGGDAIIDSGTDVDAVLMVTDSRGISGTKEIAVTMLDWTNPTAIIKLARRNNFYSDSTLTVDAMYSDINGNNAVTIEYKIKRSDQQTYTITGFASDNVPVPFTADNQYDWNVVVTITDSFNGSTTYNALLSRGTPIIYFDRLKSSVGINCFPAGDHSLEINNQTIFEMIYPVGAIYISTSAVDPGTLFGGTWTKIEDCFLLASGQTYSAGSTGGAASHTLTIAELPEHQHDLANYAETGQYIDYTSNGVTAESSEGQTGNVRTSEVGGGQAFSIMPPYIAVNVWERTA